jgi:hypothetical protein
MEHSAAALADGIDAVLPGWVERSVARLVSAWTGTVPPKWRRPLHRPVRGALPPRPTFLGLHRGPELNGRVECVVMRFNVEVTGRSARFANNARLAIVVSSPAGPQANRRRPATSPHEVTYSSPAAAKSLPRSGSSRSPRLPKSLMLLVSRTVEPPARIRAARIDLSAIKQSWVDFDPCRAGARLATVRA